MKRIFLPLVAILLLLLLTRPTFGKVYSDTDLQEYKSTSDDENTVQSDRQGNNNYNDGGCIVRDYSRYDETKTVTLPSSIITHSSGDSDSRYTTGTIYGGGNREVKTGTCLNISIQNTGTVTRYFRLSDIEVVTIKGNVVTPKLGPSVGAADSLSPGESRTISACFQPLSKVTKVQVNCQ
jgi:archaellum component FlaG (FlaF/FlaG flagellin family)